MECSQRQEGLHHFSKQLNSDFQTKFQSETRLVNGRSHLGPVGERQRRRALVVQVEAGAEVRRRRVAQLDRALDGGFDLT